MVALSAVGSGCVITQNDEVTCMRQHKRTNLLEMYLPVGTFQNELFYVTGPCQPQKLPGESTKKSPQVIPMLLNRHQMIRDTSSRRVWRCTICNYETTDGKKKGGRDSAG